MAARTARPGVMAPEACLVAGDGKGRRPRRIVRAGQRGASAK